MTLESPVKAPAPPEIREHVRKQPLFPSWVLKVTMAITGLIFSAFVLVHMIGNLKVYMPIDPATGDYEINEYAKTLRTLFYPVVPHEGVLWIFRVVLLACLILHVVSAILIQKRAKQSRAKYSRKVTTYQGWFAKTMPMTGLILLLFIIFHILDLTVGVRPVASKEFIPLDAHNNLIHSFQRPAVAIFYMLVLILLCLHIAHGVRTAVNDLGATGRRTGQIFAALGGLIAVAVLLGNISIPIAVLTGVLQ